MSALAIQCGKNGVTYQPQALMKAVYALDIPYSPELLNVPYEKISKAYYGVIVQPPRWRHWICCEYYIWTLCRTVRLTNEQL